MWTEITTSSQLHRLKKDDEVLHHPAGDGEKMNNPTGKEMNSRIYRVQLIEDDLIVLYTSGNDGKAAHFSSTGLELTTMLNGHWWIRQDYS